MVPDDPLKAAENLSSFIVTCLAPDCHYKLQYIKVAFDDLSTLQETKYIFESTALHVITNANDVFEHIWSYSSFSITLS